MTSDLNAAVESCLWQIIEVVEVFSVSICVVPSVWNVGPSFVINELVCPVGQRLHERVVQ